MNIEGNNTLLYTKDNIKINGDGTSIDISMNSDSKSATYKAPVLDDSSKWIPVINTTTHTYAAYKAEFDNAVRSLTGFSGSFDGYNRICINKNNGEPELVILYTDNTASSLKLMKSVATQNKVGVKISDDHATKTDINDIDGIKDVYTDRTYYLELSEVEEPDKFLDGNSSVALFSNVSGLPAAIAHSAISKSKLKAIRVANSSGDTMYMCTECSIHCNLQCSNNTISDKVGCILCGDTCVGTCSSTCEGGGMTTELDIRQNCMVFNICVGWGGGDIDYSTKHMSLSDVDGWKKTQSGQGFNGMSCGRAGCGLTCEGTCGLECISYCYGSCTSGCGYHCKTSCENDSSCSYYASDGASVGGIPAGGSSAEGKSYLTVRKQVCKWCRSSLLLFPI